LDFKIKLYDPVYTERVATVAGSYDDQILTNGGAWFEHVFKGAPEPSRLQYCPEKQKNI
jgi:hypothetical protein